MLRVLGPSNFSPELVTRRTQVHHDVWHVDQECHSHLLLLLLLLLGGCGFVFRRHVPLVQYVVHLAHDACRGCDVTACLRGVSCASPGFVAGAWNAVGQSCFLRY